MTILIPKCKVFSGGATTLKGLCEDLVAWCSTPANMKFMTTQYVAASSGSNDRMVLQDDEGGQIWIGHTDGGDVGFLLNPEGELSSADQPTGLLGASSHMRVVAELNGPFNGKFLWAEYPDAFMLSAHRSSTESIWMAHGGKTITTWNASDEEQGISGHALFTARRGTDSSWSNGGWTANGSTNNGYGFLRGGNYSIRVNGEEWIGSPAGVVHITTPGSVNIIRPNYPPLNPPIVGPPDAYLGFVKYSRRDSSDSLFGRMRVGMTSDQAWVSLHNTSSNFTSYAPWFLWDRTVDPNTP